MDKTVDNFAKRSGNPDASRLSGVLLKKAAQKKSIEFMDLAGEHQLDVVAAQRNADWPIFVHKSRPAPPLGTPRRPAWALNFTGSSLENRMVCGSPQEGLENPCADLFLGKDSLKICRWHNQLSNQGSAGEGNTRSVTGEIWISGDIADSTHAPPRPALPHARVV